MSFAGFDVKGMIAAGEAWVDDKKEETVSAMREVAWEAEDGMRTVVRTSVTKTGEDRVAHGGPGPGRTEDFDMYDDIDSTVEDHGDEIVARWGWIHHAEDCYFFQEYGSEEFNVRLTGMDALGTTLTRATDQMTGHLDRITRRD